jgi:hypothetical protein
VKRPRQLRFDHVPCGQCAHGLLVGLLTLASFGLFDTAVGLSARSAKATNASWATLSTAQGGVGSSPIFLGGAAALLLLWLARQPAANTGDRQSPGPSALRQRCSHLQSRRRLSLSYRLGGRHGP